MLDDTWPIYAQASAEGTLSSDSFGLTGEGKARFRNQLSTLVHVSYLFIRVWIAMPLNRLPIFYWKQPQDWPAVRRATALGLAKLPGRAVSVPPSPRYDTASLLEIVALVMGIKEADESEDAEALLGTLEAYDVSSSQGNGPLTGGPWATAHRTEAAEDFFTDLAGRIGDRDLDVAKASATFEQDSACSGSGIMTMTVQILLGGEPVSITVEVDPEDLTDAYRLLTERAPHGIRESVSTRALESRVGLSLGLLGVAVLEKC